jgi:nucleoid-associated protein YgaU
MGSVAEAVLEFDEEVSVPWRPPLSPASRGAAVLRVVPPASGRRSHAARAGRLTVPELASTTRSGALPRAAGPGARAEAHRACPHCTAAQERVPRVRLTRRARRLLAVLGAVVGVLAGIWVGFEVTGGDDGLVLASGSSVVVQQGDTLWSIARSVARDEDVRAVVDAIQSLNGMDGAALSPGQVLRLP